MSATIFDMRTFRQASPSPKEQARTRITKALCARVTHTILAQAIARAERAIAGGRNVDDAVRSAVAWALNASPDPWKPAA